MTKHIVDYLSLDVEAQRQWAEYFSWHFSEYLGNLMEMIFNDLIKIYAHDPAQMPSITLLNITEEGTTDYMLGTTDFLKNAESMLRATYDSYALRDPEKAAVWFEAAWSRYVEQINEIEHLYHQGKYRVRMIINYDSSEVTKPDLDFALQVCLHYCEGLPPEFYEIKQFQKVDRVNLYYIDLTFGYSGQPITDNR